MRSEKVMLAQAGDEKKIGEMIASGGYFFERKYDGERALVATPAGQEPSIINRTGKRINEQFPELVAMAEKLPKDCIFDGEIFVPANASKKDKPTTSGRTNVVKLASVLSRVKPAVFKCFDTIRYKGVYLVDEAYEDRKKPIKEIYHGYGVVGFDAVLPEDNPAEAWKQICEANDEGMVAKRAGSTYQFLRSQDWIKLKTWKEDDFEVVGITSEKRDISALILNNGMKVNCSLNGESYNRLMSDLIKTDEVMKANDGSIGVRLKKTYQAKIKYLHKSDEGLRFPILRELVGF